MIQLRSVRELAAVLVLVSIAFHESPAGAGTVSLADPHGISFVTIGDAGNRAVNADEFEISLINFAGEPLGAVDYEFRIAQTQMTVAQHFEFLQAYAPYWDGVGSVLDLTGLHIRLIGSPSTDPPEFVLLPGRENFPSELSWEMAARYCNWLHNDKATNREAFESGAYDTSTFTTNPDGTSNAQRERSAGARFWIPNDHEFVKAAHYDPNRYGEGDGGYWLYPTMQDTAPTPGLPGSPGAQTSAGPSGTANFIDVGLYPDSSSFYGLLDVSGAERDHIEDVRSASGVRRGVRGSFTGDFLWEFFDRGDFASASSNGTAGIRVATVVPAPAGALLLIGALALRSFTRRRPDCRTPPSTQRRR